MEHEKKKVSEGGSSGSFVADPLKMSMALLIILLLAYIATKPEPQQVPTGGNNQGGNQSINKTAKLNIALFVMSQCPYGVQAETSVNRVLDKFKGEVGLDLHFIADQNPDGTFTSLHGANEVAEDLRQVCIMKYNPDKYVGYLDCVAKDYQNIGSVWAGCASSNQIDSSVITRCSTGDEGKTLLSNNVKKSQELKVSSSPTIYLNGKQYTGGRDEGAMTRAICGVINDSDVCKNLPPEVNVKLTVVNDNSCVLCDASGIENSLKGMIYNLTINEVSYSSDEGKALLQRFNETGVPMYVFDSSIEQHSTYSTLSRYLQKSGSYYLLMVQPVKLLNMTEQNDTIELFVMSQCPYGTLAEQALNEVLGAIPGLKFGGLHFIANDLGNGSFSSLHGANEVAEDLRQVCIMKYYPKKIMNYTVCIAANYSNAGGIWQNCSTANGIDTSRIEGCATGDEGKALLKDNVAVSSSLGIYSSPTLLMNNNTLFSSVTADQMKQVVCAYNPALSGCNKTLSGAGTTAPSGGCAG